MSSKALLWSRIALCFISVAFLLLYTSQYSSYRMQYSKILQKYSESVVHSDGLAAQLRVMVERNERIERLMAEMRAKQSIVMKGNVEKYRELESAKMACSESLEKCNEEVETLRSSVNENQNEKTNEVISELRAELQRAQKKIASLEKDKSELTENVRRIEKGLEELRIEKEKCLNKEENKTAHDTKAEAEANNKLTLISSTKNYIANGKVRFDRIRAANEVLAFERHALPFVAPDLLPNKVLFKKLEQKNSQKDTHREDDGNGIEIIEPPDVNEHDYKEMH
uniref:Uncharacterized protein n=1 Tax=Parascaris univalens TaxID=6257 RepID=A0A915AZ40_PARUN